MNVDPMRGTDWQEPHVAPRACQRAPTTRRFRIIGPGGGVDVLRAVANGSPSVTGIEINPIIANTIMRGRYADYSFHLYERPEVHLHVTDGRSFVRNATQPFDVVQMTLVDTWASTAAGAFALSENSLYTVDAFREYFEHLKPDGMIAVTRWEFPSARSAPRGQWRLGPSPVGVPIQRITLSWSLRVISTKMGSPSWCSRRKRPSPCRKNKRCTTISTVTTVGRAIPALEPGQNPFPPDRTK